MGAIVRDGEIYGSNMAINDAQTSANTTWSSEKINSALNTVNATQIANGLNVYKVGKICIVQLQGTSSSASFPEGLRPSSNVSAVVRGKDGNNKYQTCLATLQSNGTFSVSYFIPNSTEATSFSGTVMGNFIYSI